MDGGDILGTSVQTMIRSPPVSGAITGLPMFPLSTLEPNIYIFHLAQQILPFGCLLDHPKGFVHIYIYIYKRARAARAGSKRHFPRAVEKQQEERFTCC